MAEGFDLRVVLELVDRLTQPLEGPLNRLQQLENQMHRVEKGTKMMLQGAGIAAAGMVIAAPLMKATEAASDLNESLNKSKVVFGEQNDEILKWAHNSAMAFGMSRQEALESASTLGDLFSGMGIGARSTSMMSMSLTQLSADMASFSNTSISQAFDAIKSGVGGEYESLSIYGIKLNQALVAQKAFQMGLIKNPKMQLSQSIQGLAVYSLIMEKAAKNTKGDFLRSSMELANSQRSLSASFKDTSTIVGQALLPIAVRLVRTVLSMVQGFNSFASHHPRIARAFVLIAAGISGVLIVAGSLLVALGALNVAWGNAVAGQILLSRWYQVNIVATYRNAIAVGAWRTATDMATFATLRQATGLAGLRLALVGLRVNLLGAATAAWAFIAPLLANPITWVVIAVVALGAALWGLWRVLTPVREMLGKLWEHIKYGVGFIVGLLAGLGLNLIRGLVRGILSGLKLVWNTVHTVASGLLGRFKAFFGIHSPSKVFAEQGQHLLDGLTDGMKDRAPALYDFLTRVIGPKVLDALKNGWNRAKAFGGNMLSTVGGWFGVGGGGGAAGGGGGGSFNPASLKLPAGADSGSTIARAAVAGLTSGWAESIPGYCSRFVRQVFSKALGPQTAKLFSTSAIDTERVWKRQGLAKTLNEIGGKAALRAGDVLFQGFGSGGYGHTGIYVGNGMVAQNTTAAGGGKKLLPVSSFGAITSVGRMPDAPRPAAQTNNSSSTHVTISNVHLPNVAHPHECLGAFQNLMESHQ